MIRSVFQHCFVPWSEITFSLFTGQALQSKKQFSRRITREWINLRFFMEKNNMLFDTGEMLPWSEACHFMSCLEWAPSTSKALRTMFGKLFVSVGPRPMQIGTNIARTDLWRCTLFPLRAVHRAVKRVWVKRAKRMKRERSPE